MIKFSVFSAVYLAYLFYLLASSLGLDVDVKKRYEPKADKIYLAEHKLLLVDSINDLIVSVSVFYVQEQPEQYKNVPIPAITYELVKLKLFTSIIF